MNALEFQREFKSSSRKPFYLVKGGDPLALNLCRETTKEVLSPESQDFNYFSFQLDESDVTEIYNCAYSSSFFSTGRIIVVNVPSFCTVTSEMYTTFEKYIKNPPDDTVIVFFQEQPNERLKFIKSLKDLNMIVECPAPDKKSLPAWLVSAFKSKGLVLNPVNAKLLLERAGGDNLNVLLGEAEKLSIYPGPGKPITPKIIKDFIRLGQSSVLYELADPLGERNVSLAISVLLDLLESNEVLSIISSLLTYFRRLLSVKFYYEDPKKRDLPFSQVAGELGLHVYYLTKIKKHSELWKKSELYEILKMIEIAYQDVMTSRVPQATIIQDLVINIGTYKQQEN
ncbi:MAG: DNA polymerase III subunit delta [Deltaproteobacteria bacterium]|jgi:DNA polymerase-3 subunit delta|nr:DNA polymerase III subunit delta [Deltaproteobacteria bacterium]